MKLRKIGAVLTGAALLGATLAGAVAQDVPPEDFFVDPETGEPNAVIVVGSGAATMDVVSATMLAAKTATMTYTQTTNAVTFTNATPINTLASLWYFDDYYNVYWGDGDEHFDPWETHEEIQIHVGGSIRYNIFCYLL